MRIIAGSAKGRKLKSVKGRGVRPTLGKVREALFDILAPRLEGARFLDLFAGVGAVGLEAASRGATWVVLVEVAPRHARLIEQNALELGLAERVRVMRASAHAAMEALERLGEAFDIIFMDPPYSEARTVADTLERLASHAGLLREGGVVVVQHDCRLAPPPRVGDLAQRRSRRFGDNTLTFYERSGDTGGPCSASGTGLLPQPEPEPRAPRARSEPCLPAP